MSAELDQIIADDPYLTAFVGTNAAEHPETGPAQRILHPKHGHDGLGVVVNLSERDVPFMDLTWTEKLQGWTTRATSQAKP